MRLRWWRVRGLSWEEFSAQGDFIRQPSAETQILADMFAKSEELRSFDREDVESEAGKKRVFDFISGYLADYAEQARVAADPAEGPDMFGNAPTTLAEILEGQRAKGGADGGKRFSTFGSSVRDDAVDSLIRGPLVSIHDVDQTREIILDPAWKRNGENWARETRYSLRTEPPPEKTGVGYKVFVQKRNPETGEMELYPPMVANPNGAGTPVGVWLNADEGVRAPDSKTGRGKVKAGIDATLMENQFGINLSQTLMNLAQNPLKERPAKGGTTAEEGAGAAETEEGRGEKEAAAELTEPAEVDAAVKAAVDEIVGDGTASEKRRHNDAFHAAVETIYGKSFDKVMAAIL